MLDKLHKIFLEENFKAVFLRIVGVFTTTVAIVRSAEYIGIKIQSFISNQNVSLIILSFLVYFFIEFLIARKHISSSLNTSHTFLLSLENELKDLFDKKQFRKILRLRDSMSRYLWVEGSLRARIKLGEYAEEAALQLGDKKSQVAALIDDLGWTLVAAKEYVRAKSCIEHGQEISKKEGLIYWEAKAHRHLAGLYTIKKEHAKAYDELETSRPLAEQVDDTIKKLELIAGIEYAIAVTALDEKDLDKAEYHVNESDRLRRQAGDESRIIRCLSLKGKIALAKGNHVAAKDYFRKGLEDATTIGRRDEMIRNNLGLATVFRIESDSEKSNYHLKLAEDLKKDTSVPYEIDNTEKQLQQI